MSGRLFVLVALLAGPALATEPTLLKQALDAEARLDSAVALELFLEADKANPDDPFVVQKIARQFSDLVLDQPTVDEKRRYAQTALDYATLSVELEPTNAENVLSLAICHGKLAVYGSAREKVAGSRLVREYAEKALALDPGYAWAHHVLGRWHYEVASLNFAERFFVRLFYGGLPSASFEDAIAHLRRAVELEPDELIHHLELGFAFAAAGRKDDARVYWEYGLRQPSRGKHDEPAKERARQALAALANR